MTTLTIPGRFNGPPGSANGGVTCGLLAQATGLGEVTLRQPPPLDVPMTLLGASLLDGETLVAEAREGHPSRQPPPPVPLETARDAVRGYAGHVEHPFPTCFVCGPEHSTGLHLFPGPVAPGVVAAPWTPDGEDPVLVWAALDCPSAWSADLAGRRMVLGRMTCRIERVPVVDQEHVVVGWHVGDDGRKVLTGSALYDQDGEVLAVAEQTWIII